MSAQCTAMAAKYLLGEKLTQVLEAERDSARDFQPLPFHYVEFARLLFDHSHASSVLVLGIFIVAYKLDIPEMIQDAERRPDARSQAADRGPRVSSLFRFINTKTSNHKELDYEEFPHPLSSTFMVIRMIYNVLFHKQ
ncbi:hypothetical protein POM88_053831 [Heracleum sosnowskyi]|uniref:Uncharacterized protein n=1 Tax=Heracleum sosnowskyi TaxID=360622 RepID=A0AAD8GNA1_9APIA|nr:hypothetical protein POM88_053831 [Heracleum sosnowskyi]